VLIIIFISICTKIAYIYSIGKPPSSMKETVFQIITPILLIEKEAFLKS